MRSVITAMLAFVLITTTTNCASDQKLMIENKLAGPNYATTNSATIVFQDKRKAVVSGAEKSSLFGYNNSSKNNKKIETRSGKPFADEFASAVKSSYNKTGSSAKTLFVNSTISIDSILQIFVTGNTLRLMLFTIYDWESRALPLFSKIRYEVIYNLELKVYNKNCDLLGTNRVNDVFSVEEEAAASIKKLRIISEDVFKEQVRLLFSKTAIRKNL